MGQSSEEDQDRLMADSLDLLHAFGKISVEADQRAVIEYCRRMRETARRPSNGSISQRNNVRVVGNGEPILFAHGFGCDQSMWRFVAPAFSDHTAVLLDHVGCGASDIRAYDEGKYSTLEGYADDIIEIGRHLALKNAVFVGHSVSSMIGALAVKKAPDLLRN